MPHRNTGGRATPPPSRASSPNDRAQDPDVETRRLSICVFCGSAPGNDPAYAEAARELGRLIGESGHSLVFGGGNVGLMGEVARAAREAGASIVGIMPDFLRHLEPPLEWAVELVTTRDLQERKSRMLARADAFVILPGGLGTLDEYFEVMTTAQLKVHTKPIIVVDVAGYFGLLEQFLRHVVSKGFAKADAMALHRFVATPGEAMIAISSLLGAQKT